MHNVAAFINLENRIHSIRGYSVILDYDLAELFQTETKALNRVVQRNLKRFPPHFMFQINTLEFDLLQSRTQIEDSGRGKHRKFMPFAFTEHGVAMLSGVLNTAIAFEINISIIETFVQLRKLRNALPAIQKQMADLIEKVDALSQRLADIPVKEQRLVSSNPSLVPVAASGGRKTVKAIQLAVTKHYGIGAKQLLSPMRSKSIAFPRQVAIYLTRKATNLSYVEIAQLFERKDHTTILFAYRKIEKLLHTDPALHHTTEQIMASVNHEDILSE